MHQCQEINESVAYTENDCRCDDYCELFEDYDSDSATVEEYYNEYAYDDFRHRTTENADTHRRDRVCTLIKAWERCAVHVVNCHMHHIIDGEAYDDRDGDALSDAQLKALHHHDGHGAHDGKHDRFYCAECHEDVSGCDD